MERKNRTKGIFLFFRGKWSCYLSLLFSLFFFTPDLSYGSTLIGEAVDNTFLTWTSGGNSPWLSQTDVSFNGGDAAQSGAITDYQYNYLETIVNGPGMLSFYWKVSSEANHDFLGFYIDGLTQAATISGEVDWQQINYPIASGNHSIRWGYLKDGSVSTGSDTGWLDYVTFTNSTSNYNLFINKSGSGNGTVSSTPAGIYCDPNCTASYPSGTAFTLTAMADTQSTFTGWSGGGCNGIDTCFINLTTDVITTATFSTNISSSEYIYSWTQTIGGPGSDSARFVKNDNNGNIFIAGTFNGTVDFDPGPVMEVYSTSGTTNLYLSKYNSDGSYGWTRTIGAIPQSISIDNNGNIYLAGYFTNLVDFDPSLSTDEHVSLGSYDIFLTKINADGSYGWTRTMGSPGDEDASSVAIDSSGNIYLTGYFSQTVDFDSGPAVDEHISKGSTDIFLTKINGDGSYSWTKTIGDLSTDLATSIFIDNSNKIFITGYFSYIVDFDPGPSVSQHTSNGSGDIFLLKMDSNGLYEWSKTAGGMDFEKGVAVATDSLNNIYLTGTFNGTADLELGNGVDYYSSAGSADIFITKIRGDGTYEWTATWGDYMQDLVASIAIDGTDNVYLTGSFMGTIDFDQYGGFDSHASAGLQDIFITRINADGSYGWTKTIGGTSSDLGNSISINNIGNLYVTGLFGGSSPIDFDPGQGIDEHTSAGSFDAFITKLSPAIISTPTSTATPSGGIYNSSQLVTLTCNDGVGSICNNIYFTTDGTEPTTLSTVYTNPLSIDTDTTLKFFADDIDGNQEPVKVENYVIHLIVPPTVDAGPDRFVNEGTFVNFSAMASDSDGYISAYNWTQVAGPLVTMNGANSPFMSFTAPFVNTSAVLTFDLTVTDNDGATTSDQVNVTVFNVIVPPTVDAGPDRFVNEGTFVNFSAMASDSDGYISAYNWTQLSGPAVTMNGANTPFMSFTAPFVNTSALLTFDLTVTDNDGATTSDQVNVTVFNVIVPPTVDAGPDRFVNEGTFVNFSAMASDSDGYISAYNWTQLSGPAVTMNGANTPFMSFTAPFVNTSALLTFDLTVTDNDGATASDQVNVTVFNVIVPPTVDAGPDRFVNEGTFVNFSAMAADSNGTIADFAWTQIGGPAVTISGANMPTMSFSAPFINASSTVVTFELTATDNDGAATSDQVSVTVLNVIIPPVVDAGNNRFADEGTPVSQTGTASDSNGTIESYSWTQVVGPAVTINASDTPTMSFIAPFINTSTLLTFDLTVTDNDGASASDRFNVTVYNVIIPPTVDAGADKTVDEGAFVNLSAMASDSNGTVTSYLWVQTAGPMVSLVGDNIASPSFTSPQVNMDQTLTFQVTVIDNDGATASDSVNVMVNNILLPPTNLTALLNKERNHYFHDLSWDQVADVTGYRIYSSDSAGGPWTLVGSTTDTSYRIEVNRADFSYYVVTTYDDGNKESTYSNWAATDGTTGGW